MIPRHAGVAIGGRTLKLSMIVVAFLPALGLSDAQAMPLAPLHSEEGLTMRVSQGCGPAWCAMPRAAAVRRR